jgi:predicted cupin superfamily sugar epimerase
MTAEKLVAQYSLLPHPEGGWYKETYRSTFNIIQSALPSDFTEGRVFSTAIYFLLEQGNFSAFHKIKSDECWHFYAGQTLLVYVINTEGKLDIIKLGSDIENGEVFQYVVPANCWFASIPASHAGFCFVGCTVSPGFDFNDFELAKADDLINEFPNLSEEIKKLCRQ